MFVRSVLMGALIVGAFGMVKIYQLQTEIKKLKKSGASIQENIQHPNVHKPQMDENKDHAPKQQENNINK